MPVLVTPSSRQSKYGVQGVVEKVFERGVLEVCGTLEGDTWQGTSGLVGGELWECKGSWPLTRG